MNEFQASYDGSMRYKVKPNRYDAIMISDRLPHCGKSVNEDRFKSFVGLVSKEGMPFCPATFTNGIRNQDNFKQLQLLALDFDNSKCEKQISFQDLKARADKLHLPILFAYDTLSSSVQHDKFRVVFLNDVSISSKRIAGVMLNALHTIFPEADSSCKDVSRIFYGGKYQLYFDEDVPQINILSTISGMTKHMEDRYGKTNYKRKIEEFNRTNHIVPNAKGMPDVSIVDNAEDIGVSPNNKNSPRPSINIEGFGDNLLKRYYAIKFHNENTNSSAKEKKSKNHADFRPSVLTDIRSTCRLFQEYESGSSRLHHMELFGLATNLTKVETGSKWFLDTFDKNSYSNDHVGDSDYWTHQLKNYISGYNPQSCDKFCPYCDCCTHGTNILSSSKLRYHQIERLANYNLPLVSAKEVAADFEQSFSTAMDSIDTKWHVIKAQTAIGKTETYLRLLGCTAQKVLIAVPTNKLKHEVQERAGAMGIKIVESPSLHEFKNDLPDEIWSYIEHLYSSGKSVIPYLKKCIAEDNPECSTIFKQYLRELDEFNNFAGNAITTHRRLLTMDVSRFDFVIVDEDIIFDTIIPNKTDIPISCLKRIRKKFHPNSPAGKKARQVLCAIKDAQFFTIPKAHYDRTDDDKPMGVDLSSFCSATHFCYRSTSDKNSNLTEDCISFLNPIEFQKDTKYIMVSATADERICEYYFGAGHVKFYDCKKAAFKGILNQFYDRSMSRADIDRAPAIIDRIKKWSGFKYTISFKKYHLDDLYFGNSAGCDTLKGKNIDVIGTPHQPEWVYKLFAYSLSLDCDIDAKIKPCVTVKHNGYSFRFTTYDDKVLRSIQFYMIESELEQAVGRARLLRCDCTVNLFSNFPLSQAVLKESEYDIC